MGNEKLISSDIVWTISLVQAPLHLLIFCQHPLTHTHTQAQILFLPRFVCIYTHSHTRSHRVYWYYFRTYSKITEWKRTPVWKTILWGGGGGGSARAGGCVCVCFKNLLIFFFLYGPSCIHGGDDDDDDDNIIRYYYTEMQSSVNATI